MTTNDFFAKMEKATFVFATVLMMSMAFTACSGKDDDDNGGGSGSGGSEVPPQTIVLDGEEKKVQRAVLEDKGNDDFFLFLYLSKNPQDFVEVNGNALRYKDTTINLTMQEENKPGLEWVVRWLDQEGYKFESNGRNKSLLFKNGTMRINVNLNTGYFEVMIANGKVHNKAGDSNDGKEHTITLNWKGTAEIVKED